MLLGPGRLALPGQATRALVAAGMLSQVSLILLGAGR
jgi:hypothetical protein